jgi:endo-1,4-beta-xylanase
VAETIRVATAIEARLDAARLRLTDTRREPFAYIPIREENSALCFPYPGEAFGLAYPLAVPGFECLYLWADGKGYTSRPRELLLEQVLAHSRYRRSLEFIKQYQRKGVTLADALAHLDAAHPPAVPESDSCLQSLQKSLLAGEEATLAVARYRLSRIGWREAFLWGVQLNTPSLAVPMLHPPFNQLSLSMADVPPEAWEPTVQQAQQERLLVKGEKLITCDVIRKATEQPVPLLESLLNRLQHGISLYRGRVRYWEILSDLPDSLNLLADDFKTRLVLLGTLCERARALDTGMVRLLGATYSLMQQRAVYDLLDCCVEQGIPFEGVNLHLYWHDFDLLDFDLVVEHYGDLGKPLHLTLHLPPADGDSLGKQAEWLRRAWLVAMSKPFVVGVQVALNALAPSTLQQVREWRQMWKQSTSS